MGSGAAPRSAGRRRSSRRDRHPGVSRRTAAGRIAPTGAELTVNAPPGTSSGRPSPSCDAAPPGHPAARRHGEITPDGRSACAGRVGGRIPAPKRCRGGTSAGARPGSRVRGGVPGTDPAAEPWGPPRPGRRRGARRGGGGGRGRGTHEARHRPGRGTAPGLTAAVRAASGRRPGHGAAGVFAEPVAFPAFSSSAFSAAASASASARSAGVRASSWPGRMWSGLSPTVPEFAS